MCGITGQISNSNIDLDSLVKMNQIIQHRGPDDEGFVLFNENVAHVLGSSQSNAEIWKYKLDYLPAENIEEFKPKANIAFGHRRLSILDLSVTGHQPMCNSDKRYWITFNGEIYNYLEIKEELKEKGYNFVSESDTEVILNAYQEWGMDCQHKFKGMWSFVIYDVKQSKLFISRDRFGIKPLYYWFNPNGDFYFASEIKQFTVIDGWKAQLNVAAAYDYLKYSITDHTDETLFKGVFSLPPGCCVHISVNDLLKSSNYIAYSRWYELSEQRSKINYEESKLEFYSRFKSSVDLHLRSDVQIGSSLSGGLDSAAIVSMINEILEEQGKSNLQKTFTSCSKEAKYDERHWAESVVKRFNLDAEFIYPEGEAIFNLTDKIIWHLDEPYQSQSAFLGYHVFSSAKASDIKVLLNGQGADEYLSGYGEFRKILQLSLLRKFKLAQVKKELGSYQMVLSLIVKTFSTRFNNFLRNSFNFSLKSEFDNLLNSNLFKDSVHPYKKLKFVKSNELRVAGYQLFHDPLQRYLRWEDRLSMANSIEARVPFLDHELVEFVVSLPLSFKDDGTTSKKVLVEALEKLLPTEIFNRKDKMGFITAEASWFTKDCKSQFLKLFDDNIDFAKGVINKSEARKYIIEMQEGKMPFDYSYWRIILFCIWMRVFKVEIE
jgi:asparagine synthase (glutamine-hydrolysing)